MTEPTEATGPPGPPGVWHRILRAYGPLAALVIVLVLVSLLVPTKVPMR